jgi:hypothetical protein
VRTEPLRQVEAWLEPAVRPSAGVRYSHPPGRCGTHRQPESEIEDRQICQAPGAASLSNLVLALR